MSQGWGHTVPRQIYKWLSVILELVRQTAVPPTKGDLQGGVNSQRCWSKPSA